MPPSGHGRSGGSVAVHLHRLGVTTFLPSSFLLLFAIVATTAASATTMDSAPTWIPSPPPPTPPPVSTPAPLSSPLAQSATFGGDDDVGTEEENASMRTAGVGAVEPHLIHNHGGGGEGTVLFHVESPDEVEEYHEESVVPLAYHDNFLRSPSGKKAGTKGSKQHRKGGQPSEGVVKGKGSKARSKSSVQSPEHLPHGVGGGVGGWEGGGDGDGDGDGGGGGGGGRTTLDSMVTTSDGTKFCVYKHRRDYRDGDRHRLLLPLEQRQSSGTVTKKDSPRLLHISEDRSEVLLGYPSTNAVVNGSDVVRAPAGPPRAPTLPRPSMKSHQDIDPQGYHRHPKSPKQKVGGSKKVAPPTETETGGDEHGVIPLQATIGRTRKSRSHDIGKRTQQSSRHEHVPHSRDVGASIGSESKHSRSSGAVAPTVTEQQYHTKALPSQHPTDLWSDGLPSIDAPSQSPRVMPPPAVLANGPDGRSTMNPSREAVYHQKESSRSFAHPFTSQETKSKRSSSKSKSGAIFIDGYVQQTIRETGEWVSNEFTDEDGAFVWMIEECSRHNGDAGVMAHNATNETYPCSDFILGISENIESYASIDIDLSYEMEHSQGMNATNETIQAIGGLMLQDLRSTLIAACNETRNKNNTFYVDDGDIRRSLALGHPNPVYFDSRGEARVVEGHSCAQIEKESVSNDCVVVEDFVTAYMDRLYAYDDGVVRNHVRKLIKRRMENGTYAQGFEGLAKLRLRLPQYSSEEQGVYYAPPEDKGNEGNSANALESSPENVARASISGAGITLVVLLALAFLTTTIIAVQRRSFKYVTEVVEVKEEDYYPIEDNLSTSAETVPDSSIDSASPSKNKVHLHLSNSHDEVEAEGADQSNDIYANPVGDVHKCTSPQCDVCKSTSSGPRFVGTYDRCEEAQTAPSAKDNFDNTVAL